ncbi:MAG: DUF4325 domain-containing protein [Thermoplasmata archaeon]|nr:DUF4325 domain-containing protein [Thermoplasmata archaeon]
MTSQAREVRLVDILSPNLLLRCNARELFFSFERFSDEEIIVDFSGIRTITRSFAHEYSQRKNRSSRTIVERSLPENIRKMLLVVRSTSKRNALSEIDATPVVTL